jgi:hypothetical protein
MTQGINIKKVRYRIGIFAFILMNLCFFYFWKFGLKFPTGKYNLILFSIIIGISLALIKSYQMLKTN